MQEYVTSDFYESIANKTAGLQVLRLQQGKRGRIEFVFENNELRKKVGSDFWNGQLTVNLREFLSHWKLMRRQLDQFQKESMGHDGTRNEHRSQV